MLKATGKGSFVVRILDQQHSTWQGTITWISNNEKKSFRSANELFRMIDDALRSETYEADATMIEPQPITIESCDND